MKLKSNLSDQANGIVEFVIDNGREQNLLPLTVVILNSGKKLLKVKMKMVLVI